MACRLLDRRCRHDLIKRLVVPLALAILLVGLPTWSFRQRHHYDDDLESPPIEPSESSFHHMRPRRDTKAAEADASTTQEDELSHHHEQRMTGDASQVAAGYLLADSTDRLLNMSDPLDRNISKVLDSNGPDMRPSREFNQVRISMEMSKRAWMLMREHARIAITDRILLAWPAIKKLLEEARVSDRCSRAIDSTFEGAKRMEAWALKLLNAWGSFPMSGLFEGTYSDVGAYHSCLDIRQIKHIDHAHYCSVTFRPLMSTPREYEIIIRPLPRDQRMYFEDLKRNATRTRNATDSTTSSESVDPTTRDAATDLLEHAQYHNFVYYKWGTCWPIGCNPVEIRRIAKVVGRKSILRNGPVKCYSKSPDDYEQEYEDLDDLVPASSDSNQTTQATNSSQPQQLLVPRRKKLQVSVWDKNDGIFVWKPHFTVAQKIAAAVIVLVSVLIFSMTFVDIFVNHLPRLGKKLERALRGLPIDDDDDGNRSDRSLQGPNGNTTAFSPKPRRKFALCSMTLAPTSETMPQPIRKHPSQPEFQMIPSDSNTAESAHDVARDLTDAATMATRPPPPPPPGRIRKPTTESLFMGLVDECSIINNVRTFFHISESQLENDVRCLHGIRCLTMGWIILTHTMLYNEWSAFARSREIEVSLKSLIMQPLFNASYLVDTFFLMSGLLSALTAFKHCQGLSARFNSFAFIMGRWLRLTPQILFVSLIFIVLPILSNGPHWWPIVAESSENCAKNWWINVLHLQSFIRQHEMCNFVTWWISIDFFYHFLALGTIWIILMRGHQWGLYSMALLVGSMIAWQSKLHYEFGLTPNVFSTVPQTGFMWTIMTLKFSWTPFTHTVPFFFGFYIGYLFALKPKLIARQLNTRRALLGWLLAGTMLVGMQYSTYWWVTGQAGYSKVVATLFYGACSLVWNASISWIIVACQMGYGGLVNQILSWRPFIVLGKASYVIYLSHFQILFVWFGNQSLLLEPSFITISYIIAGNIFVSTVYGIILCCVYELPWLKVQRRLMKYV